MKTMEEVAQSQENASPMELACATVDMMASAIRFSVEQDDRTTLNKSLVAMRAAVDMIQRWVEESVN